LFLHQKEHTAAVRFSVLSTLSSGFACPMCVLSTLWGGFAHRTRKGHTVAVGFPVLSTLSSGLLDNHVDFLENPLKTADRCSGLILRDL
jgi:hypothetical protein